MWTDEKIYELEEEMTGFWDTLPTELAKPLPKQVEVSKPAEPKAKKVPVMAPPKKENPLSVDLDMWCNNMLTSTTRSDSSIAAGFWDTLPTELAKPLPKQIEVSKPAEPKAKKKVPVMAPPKKENPLSVDLDMWCNNMLTSTTRRDSSIAAGFWDTLTTELAKPLPKQAEVSKPAEPIAKKVPVMAPPKKENPPSVNLDMWCNNMLTSTTRRDTSTAAGFWDTPSTDLAESLSKQAEVSKPAEPKVKKKATVMAPPKKQNSPSVEFDMWCYNTLTSWRDTGIDIPTFVCFLKDIESPYEVKDYVKCYLGDTRKAGDFARQFLERRSRMLRVGMVTPSDDLCSPAVAINPRTNSGSDYTEVKGKGKKTKKNKMLKVDARNLLGFSVTASADRINVGDIDTVYSGLLRRRL